MTTNWRRVLLGPWILAFVSGGFGDDGDGARKDRACVEACVKEMDASTLAPRDAMARFAMCVQACPDDPEGIRVSYRGCSRGHMPVTIPGYPAPGAVPGGSPAPYVLPVPVPALREGQ